MEAPINFRLMEDHEILKPGDIAFDCDKPIIRQGWVEITNVDFFNISVLAAKCKSWNQYNYNYEFATPYKAIFSEPFNFLKDLNASV